MFPTGLDRVASPPLPSYAVTLQGKDMSEFNIKLTLDLHCKNTDENDHELDILCDFITDRLHVVGADIVIQSLAEALIELHDQNAEDKARKLH
jgi:hypothetical protein